MNTLHTQLVNACEYYAMLDRYNNAISNLMEQNLDLDIDYDNIKRKGFRAAPGILIIIFSGVFLLFACPFACTIMISAIPYGDTELELGLLVSVLLSMLIIPLTVCAALVYKLVFCRARTRKIQQHAQQEWLAKYGPIKANNEKAIDQLISESKAFSEKNRVVLDFLPDIYRSQLAAAFMERTVRTGRADTLKEAINLYEEQLHRWTLEEQGRRMLQQKELQSDMIREQLTSILHEQRKATNSLQNIESLEFYNTFCR